VLPKSLSQQVLARLSALDSVGGSQCFQCPQPSTAAAQATSDDLFSFLKAIPDGRYRRGDRYTQWFLLLVAVLGILSGCRSSRDLEAFARRHREALNQALGLDSSAGHPMPPSCTCSTTLTAGVPRAGPGCTDRSQVGPIAWSRWYTTARRCAVQPSRQTTEATAMASGRLGLCRLGHRLRPGTWCGPGPKGLRNACIHRAGRTTPPRCFSMVPRPVGRRALHRQVQPEDPLPPARLPVRGEAPESFHCKRSRETPWARHVWELRAKEAPEHVKESWPESDCGGHHRHGRAQWQPRRAASPVPHQRPQDAKSPAAPDSATLEH
jgi:hypothetical protein